MKVYVAAWHVDGMLNEICAYSAEQKAKDCIARWKSHYKPNDLELDEEFEFADGYADDATVYELELDEGGV